MSSNRVAGHRPRSELQSPPPPAPLNDVPEAKRRKIRKGTRSCWECKRRKSRCIYTTAADETCEGCRRRGTKCVSQEHPEEPSTTNGSARQVGDRLVRMESLVEQLVKQVSSNAPVGRGDIGMHAAWRSVSVDEEPDVNHDLPTPNSQQDGQSVKHPAFIDLEVDGPGNEIQSDRSHLNPLKPISPSYLECVPQPVQSPEQYVEVSKTLHAAFPSDHDREILSSFMGLTAGLFHQLMWMPYSDILNGKQETVEDFVALPSPTSHPALLGVKMLMLATFVQYFHPKYHPGLAELQEDIYIVKNRLFDTAVDLVTTNNDLVGSVEGLQCIMLEAIYQANNGNLRRSWLAFRRAMVIAQLMGFHRASLPAGAVKFLDTRSKADPKHMWFRIVYADRYLSMMIGMPLGSFDTFLTYEGTLRTEDPMDRLERMHAAIAMRMLDRSERLLTEECYALTQEIDADIQMASRSMPPRWWLSPQLDQSNDNTELFRDSLRLVNQVFHYNLLNQLYLPYMMRHSAEHRYDCSKMICVNAAREQLTRFISFRSVNLVAFSCRSVDFFALMASMTLILAHLESHKSQHTNFLAHQRLGDRGLTERVLENFEDIYALNNDLLSKNTALILKRLLAIEADAANGEQYSTVSEEGAKTDCCVGDEKDALTLYIPFFGTIRIAKDGVSKAESKVQPRPQQSQPKPIVPPTDGTVPSTSLAQDSCQVTPEEALGTEWDTSPTQFPDQMVQTSSVTAYQQNISGNLFDGTPNQLYVASLTADADDWAFQGVDMAFFDNLMRGVNGSGLGADDHGNWSNWEL